MKDMKRHPVPRHVAGYEFRLIGDMTLKQFGELAAGEIMALICWSLPLISIIKYPLVAFFALLGIGLAFVPINEQPLDRWIINFFRAVYSPTQFIWQKSKVALDFFERPAYPQPPQPAKPTPPADRKKLEEYLKTMPAPAVSLLEKEMETRLQKISSLFGEVVSEPRVIEPVEPLPKKPLMAMPTPPLPVEEKPEAELEKISSLFEEEAVTPETLKIPKIKRTSRKTVKPKFEPELPMPSRPTVPNLLVGMVLTPEGKILPDVIIEIRDKEGFPVRALKANKLGQFRIATPLKNDTYEIEAEKENYKFDIIKLKAEGEIIEPMEIRAKEGPAHAD